MSTENFDRLTARPCHSAPLAPARRRPPCSGTALWVADVLTPRTRSAGATAERPVAPAGGHPGLPVEGIASVQDALLRHHPAEGDRVELAVLPPLGEHQHGVGSLRGLLGG